MTVWEVTGFAAALFCVCGGAWTRVAGRGLAATVAVVGSLWLLLSLGDRATPARLLVVALVAAAVRRAVVVWRISRVWAVRR